MIPLDDALAWLREHRITAHREGERIMLDSVPPGVRVPLDLTAALASYPGDLSALTPAPRSASSSDGWQPRIICLENVQPERVQWLWYGRIALGKVAVLDGDPGDGKSTLTLDLAARVSTGRTMPDDTPGIEAAGVVLMNGEDGLADTIRPRLDAAGGDPRRVVALECAEAGERERGVTLADLPMIEAAITQVKARLVIVDPLMAYLGPEVNSYRDQDVRSILAPLARLAERTGVAILVVRHFSKGMGAKAIHKGGGSVGIGGAARTVMMVARDPDDPDGPRRILAQIKSNVGVFPPALAFHIEEAGNGAARVIWEGITNHTATTLVAMPIEADERSARTEVENALRAALVDGERPSEDVKREVQRMTGATDKQLRTARERVGIIVRREGFGPGAVSRWAIPAPIGAHGASCMPIDAHTRDGASMGIYSGSRASMREIACAHDVPDTSANDDPVPDWIRAMPGGADD